ncbi:MAG: hypothetical protein J6S67_09140 [Methanobrevibacter sp.]|nr:hypothetical protein [Methanobrevibacter sp.]
MSKKNIENTVETNVNDIATYTESFALPEMSTELTVSDKDGIVTKSFMYKSTDKDGNVTYKTAKSELTMSFINSVNFWAKVGKVAPRNIAIEMAQVTEEMAKSEGYKSVKEMIKSIYPNYTDNTINGYRRAGWFFGIKEIDEKGQVHYRYRNGIDGDTSINNLTAVLTLCNIPKDYQKLSTDEVNGLYKAFYEKYILTGEINLSLPQSELKKQISAIQNTIDGNCEDKTNNSDNSDNSDNSENTENKTVDKNSKSSTESVKSDDVKTTAINSVNALALIFKGNTAILGLLDEIARAVDNL